MLLFVEILASLVENFWAIYIPGKLMGRREVKWRDSCIAVIFLTLCVSVINRYILFSVITSAVGVLLIAFVVRFLYQAKLTEALFAAGCYIAVIYIFDFFVLALLGTVSGNPDYASMVADEYSYLRMWFLIISKLCLCCVCALFLKYCERLKLQQLFRRPWLLLEIMVLYYLVNGTLLQSDIGALISWLMLLALIALGVYVVLQRFVTQAQREQMLLEMEIVRMKTENYERFMEDYRRNQVFYHDLKNHYLILKAHLANGEFERAEAYIENLALPSGIEDVVSMTGIESLDILITYKRNEAERRGICISIIAEPVSWKLTEAESVALFGNLLDNAIEACENMEKEDRWISVAIRRIRQMTFIKVENACQEELYNKEERFQTKKADSSVHGIGLKSIISMVEQYDGVIKTEYSEGLFSVIISFFD